MSERMVSVAATRVPERIFEAVRASAKENDRSISSELRRCIVKAYSTAAKESRS